MISAAANILIPTNLASCTGNILPVRESNTVIGGCAGGLVRGEDLAIIYEGVCERRLSSSVPSMTGGGFRPWSGWNLFGSYHTAWPPYMIRAMIHPQLDEPTSSVVRRWFDSSAAASFADGVAVSGAWSRNYLTFEPATPSISSGSRMTADHLRRMYYDLKRMTCWDLWGCQPSGYRYAIDFVQGQTTYEDGSVGPYTNYMTSVLKTSGGYTVSECGAVTARPLTEIGFPHSSVVASSECTLRGGYAFIEFVMTTTIKQWLAVPFGTDRSVSKSAWNGDAVKAYLEANGAIVGSGCTASIVALAYDIHFPVAVEDVSGWTWTPPTT